MSDITRSEAIEILKDWDGYFIGHNSDDVNEALDMAISSLETDEAYQLEYESTTKNDLGVDVLDKIRAEIEQDAFSDVNGEKFIFVNRINQIIDKYKAESEPQESEEE